VVLAVVSYGVLATLAYLPSWPGDPGHLPTCACGDPVNIAWFLRWTPFAVFHGHNPLYTTFIEYPGGVNLAQNTSMPLLGMLSAPVSWLFGPVSSTTLFLWLAITSSAGSCFLVLRRWVTWLPAAYVGGLFYGFSPYMVGQAAGHLNLVFVPLPPLILLSLYELVVAQHGEPVRWGLALGAAAAAQELISPEILLSTALFSVIGLVVLAVARPGECRRRAGHAVRGMGWAALVAVPVIVYPAWFGLAGTHAYVGSAHGSYPFPADLLAAVVPNRDQLLTTPYLSAVGNRFIMGNITENGGYLGVPLIVVLSVIVVRGRRVAWIRFAAVMAVIAWLLSLGPRLTVDDRTTSFPLPLAVLDRIPLVDSLVAARLSLFLDLFVAVLLAVGADRWWARRRRRRIGAGDPGGRRADATDGGQAETARSRRAGAVVVAVALVAVVASLLPDWPVAVFPATVPSFFSSTASRRIPAGSVALTYPYPAGATNQAMLWQADDDMAFRLVGGYAIVPGADGQATFDPLPPGSEAVPAALMAAYDGVSPSQEVPGLSSTPPSPAQVRAFLRANDVHSVLVHPVGADPGAVVRLFTAALGPPDTRTGGVVAWFDLDTG